MIGKLKLLSLRGIREKGSPGIRFFVKSKSMKGRLNRASGFGSRARTAKTPPHVLICGTGQRSLFNAIRRKPLAKSVQSTDFLNS